MVIAEAPFFAP